MAHAEDDSGGGLSGLSSEMSIARLKKLAALRACGIGESIDLPQLVVCGDQSAGKSSVLTGLTGIRFPRSEGLCTRFATEVVVEHTEADERIVATIIPESTCALGTRNKLKDFKRTFSEFSDFPQVLSDAGTAMGLQGYGGKKDGPTFVKHVLRTTYTGRTGLHLSIVDLPGLILTTGEGQDREDVTTIQNMVESYIKNPRTIILAIVQAGNDVYGERTVGIITKTDLLNRGGEASVAKLAKDQGATKLKLGWYLLKNPHQAEPDEEDMSLAQRSIAERNFFQDPAWRKQQLDYDYVGILKLRERCQDMLDKQIQKEFPKLRNEIKAFFADTEREIERLPKERKTIPDMRQYLSELAQLIQGLAQAALSGDYTVDAKFFDSPGDGPAPTRLRALIQAGNDTFMQCMWQYGQSRKLGIQMREPSDEDQEMYDGYLPALRKSVLAKEQEYMTQDQLEGWVEKTYTKCRGRELPGDRSEILLAELFQSQSRKWPAIARSHVQDTIHNIEVFIDKALAYLDIEYHVESCIREEVANQLSKCEKLAAEELKKLFADEAKHPITDSLAYGFNVGDAKVRRLLKTLQACGGVFPFHVIKNAEELVAFLEPQFAVHHAEQEPAMSLARMNNYYTAIRTFIDNVCRQVVERHLADPLTNCFSQVSRYTDEQLQHIAGERPEMAERRRKLEQRLQMFSDALKVLV